MANKEQKTLSMAVNDILNEVIPDFSLDEEQRDSIEDLGLGFDSRMRTKNHYGLGSMNDAKWKNGTYRVEGDLPLFNIASAGFRERAFRKIIGLDAEEKYKQFDLHKEEPRKQLITDGMLYNGIPYDRAEHWGFGVPFHSTIDRYATSIVEGMISSCTFCRPDAEAFAKMANRIFSDKHIELSTKSMEITLAVFNELSVLIMAEKSLDNSYRKNFIESMKHMKQISQWVEAEKRGTGMGTQAREDAIVTTQHMSIYAAAMIKERCFSETTYIHRCAEKFVVALRGGPSFNEPFMETYTRALAQAWLCVDVFTQIKKQQGVLDVMGMYLWETVRGCLDSE